MAIAAAPAAASGARKAAGKAAGAAKTRPAPSKGKGDLPGRGDWRQRRTELGEAGGSKKPGRSGTSRALKGASGTYRRWLIAEFIVCVMLLGLSPLAKGPGEMGPVRFMKRGSATCALFVILGLLSAGGRGAAKAAAAFGALVTLVLLVDQREAFGKLATILAASDDDDTVPSVGPDESTDDGPPLVEV